MNDFVVKPKEGLFEIYLTAEALKHYGTIWTLIPRAGKILKKGKPFANIEARCTLTCLRSPMDGHIVKWNQDMLRTPDLIDEATCLLTVEQ